VSAPRRRAALRLSTVFDRAVSSRALHDAYCFGDRSGAERKDHGGTSGVACPVGTAFPTFGLRPSTAAGYSGAGVVQASTQSDSSSRDLSTARAKKGRDQWSRCPHARRGVLAALLAAAVSRQGRSMTQYDAFCPYGSS
jgi:hypothetical protein